jgi:hypothetical protein
VFWAERRGAAHGSGAALTDVGDADDEDAAHEGDQRGLVAV